MESEKAQNFNDRLNQWIAAQGFWFQLKYSMLGSGSGGAAKVQLFQLAIRLLVFVLIVGLGGLIYLIRRPSTEGFRSNLETSLVREIGASKGEMLGFQRSQGKLIIAKFSALGGEDTFFTALEARNITCQMGLFEGLMGPKEPGTVSIAQLDIDLRAGTSDAGAAETLGRAVFKQRPDVNLRSIDVEAATVSWGYSPLTRGIVEDSQLKIRRSGDGWKFQFKGGRFSQNWLRNLEIEDLVVLCTPSGITFEKANFRSGAGRVAMTGLTVTGKEQPAVKGLLKVIHLPVETILSPLALNYVEGSISGEFNIGGSTNSTEGVGFEGKVTLEEGDSLTLRDRLPLLRALSGADIFNNYRTAVFREGAFSVKTSGGSLTLGGVDLKDDLLTLKGDLLIRYPTTEEMQRKPAAPIERSPLFTEPVEDRPVTPVVAEESVQEEDIDAEASEDQPEQLPDREQMRLAERRSRVEEIDRTARSYRYEGMFEISLRPNAFDRSPKLQSEFPVSDKTGRIHLKVPIEGVLSEITLPQASEIQGKGSR